MSRLFTQDQDQDLFLKTKTKTKTLRLKTKTLFLVLEAPRDQDHVLEDYSTGYKHSMVSCPNVWLQNREGVYLRICLFGRLGRTCAVRPVFPLQINENFKFEKIFPYARGPAQVAAALQDLRFSVKLVQQSSNYGPCSAGDTLLAAFESSAGSFLYPYPSDSSDCSGCGSVRNSGGCRTLLLDRTCDFPGAISPEVKFTTKTVIRDPVASSAKPRIFSFDEAAYKRNANRACRPTPLASRVIRFTRPPWDSSPPGTCSPRSLSVDRPGPCECAQRRAELSFDETLPCQPGHRNYKRPRRRKRMSRSLSRPCSSLPDDPCSSAQRCRCSACGASYQPRGVGGRSRSHPPSLQRQRSCSPKNSNTLDDFSYSYLNQSADNDCCESRPPFVVRRVDSKVIRRTPAGLGGEANPLSTRRICRSTSRRRKSRLSSAHRPPPCSPCNSPRDEYGVINTPPSLPRQRQQQQQQQYVEICTVCEAYERYMGKPYSGHRNGCHPIGLQRIPIQVTRSTDGCSGGNYGSWNDVEENVSGRNPRPREAWNAIDRSLSGRTKQQEAYGLDTRPYDPELYADSLPQRARSHDELSERIEQAMRLASGALSTTHCDDEDRPRVERYINYITPEADVRGNGRGQRGPVYRQ